MLSNKVLTQLKWSICPNYALKNMYFTITSEVHTFRALYEYAIWKVLFCVGTRERCHTVQQKLWPNQSHFSLILCVRQKTLLSTKTETGRVRQTGSSGNERERDRLCVCVHCAPQDWVLHLPADTLHHKRPNAISHAAFFCLHTNISLSPSHTWGW